LPVCSPRFRRFGFVVPTHLITFPIVGLLPIEIMVAVTVVYYSLLSCYGLSIAVRDCLCPVLGRRRIARAHQPGDVTTELDTAQERPLQIRRGWMVASFDHSTRQRLDCVSLRSVGRFVFVEDPIFSSLFGIHPIPPAETPFPQCWIPPLTHTGHSTFSCLGTVGY